MSKMLTACAAIAVAAVVALPVAAGAVEQRTDGARNINRVDANATRQHQRRQVRQAPAVTYGEPGYYAPYEAYGYAPGFAPDVDTRVTGGHAAFGFGG
jgi:Ni/Co efflux regulator RcnB